VASHKISVTVEKDGIRVAPDPLSMTSVDDVQWAGTNAAAFSIVFDDERAFGVREMAHAMASSPNRARAKGRFKYTVVSGADRNVKLDPIIIVGDPPTTPNP
jgi:hypothetical protein